MNGENTSMPKNELAAKIANHISNTGTGKGNTQKNNHYFHTNDNGEKHQQLEILMYFIGERKNGATHSFGYRLLFKPYY